MRRPRGFHRQSSHLRSTLGCCLGVALGTAASASAEPVDPELIGTTQTVTTLDRVEPGRHATGAICNGPRRCYAHALVDESGHVQAFATPAGYGPGELEAAYKIDLAKAPAKAPTVVLIDAYGYANLESDLATYRTTYNLPACTTASGCLTIVNQSGQTSPLPGAPPAGDDWTVETALDLDMVSAGCPSCKIVVVQADDDTGDGLFVANNLPSTLGATVVSNSWGGPEQSGTPATLYESYFNHPGAAIFVAAGDNGYDDAGQGPDYPSTSGYTIAVGATSLTQATNARGWSETAWSSGGSSCSLSIPKPSYQSGTSCSYKATTDLAAVGDPQNGVAIYNNGAWQVVGGTSAASPLTAAIFAFTGNGNPEGLGAFVKANAQAFNDVTSGSNGTCGNILCTAGVGWDGPTGWGTPNAGLLAEAAVASGEAGSGGGGDTSADDGDPEVVTGGCATTGGSSAATSLVALALVITRRRRSGR